MSNPQSEVRTVKTSAWPAAVGVLMLASVVLACNLSNRLTEKKRGPIRCFADNGSSAAGGQDSQLVTSDDGGFTVKLPRGFPQPDPPEPIRQGFEYSGVTYYSYVSGCRCRLNYTDVTAMAAWEKSDAEVLRDRLELAGMDKEHPSSIERTAESTVQDHPALSVFVSGTGINGAPEFRRHKFIVARGRVYEIQFAAEDKAELDHPEVNAYFDSFKFTGELDTLVIDKPAPEYPDIGRATKSSGTVAVEVIVNTNGRVMEAHAISGSRFLHRAAEQAALKARFAPGKTQVSGVLTYTFGP